MRSVIAALCVFVGLATQSLPARADGASYAQALSKRLGIRAEGMEIDGRPAFVLVPDEDKSAADSRQPWIMYAPALPAYPDEHERWLHQQFVKNGVAVAGIDVGEAYGSPRGRVAMSALYDELVENRNFAPRLCLFGRSRGGLWVISWAGQNPDKATGIIGIYPAFDLRTYPGLEKAAPAYELSTAQLEAQLPTLNPIEQIDALAKAKVPAMFIHGIDDQVVPFTENTGEYATRYKAAGAGELVTVLAIEEQGHNFWDGFFRSQELADFAVARAKAGVKQAAQ